MEQVQHRATTLQPFIQTSLTEVTNALPIKPPCRIFFKNEYEQPSGSFKLRGIGNLIQRSIADAHKQGIKDSDIIVLASSGGNAGLAAAYASKFYNVACLVCLPTITKPHIITKLHEYNAKTIKVGANINEADSFLKNEVMSQFSGMHIIYCHPFDNPYIWEGHSSLVDELSLQLSARDSSKLKSIVCSVGGGGLYNGIFQGLQKNLSNFNNYPNLLLIETNQAPTMAATLKAGKVFTLDSVNSVATSLACSYLSPKSLKNFQLKNESGIESILATIDDLESVKALVEFYNHTGIVVEPACGAALSVVYNQLHLLRESMDLKEDDIIVIVACGGSCTSREGLNEFKKLITRQNNKL